MNLSAPTQAVFVVATVLAVLGLLGQFGVVTALAQYDFWLVVAGWAVLTAGNLLRGL